MVQTICNNEWQQSAYLYFHLTSKMILELSQKYLMRFKVMFIYSKQKKSG